MAHAAAPAEQTNQPHPFCIEPRMLPVGMSVGIKVERNSLDEIHAPCAQLRIVQGGE